MAAPVIDHIVAVAVFGRETIAAVVLVARACAASAPHFLVVAAAEVAPVVLTRFVAPVVAAIAAVFAAVIATTAITAITAIAVVRIALGEGLARRSHGQRHGDGNERFAFHVCSIGGITRWVCAPGASVRQTAYAGAFFLTRRFLNIRAQVRACAPNAGARIRRLASCS